MTSAQSVLLSLAPGFVLTILCLGYAIGSRRTFADAERGGRRLLGSFFRNYWYWLHLPLERAALALRLTPDQLTWLGLAAAVTAAIAFAVGRFALAGWLIVLGGSFDILDGRMARLTGRERKSGAFLDSTLDRYGDAAIVTGLAIYYRGDWGLYAALGTLCGSFFVSYIRARAEAAGATCRAGFVQRAERLLFLAAGGILTPVLAWALAVPDMAPMRWVLLQLAVLTNLTALQRLHAVLSALRQAETPPISRQRSR